MGRGHTSAAAASSSPGPKFPTDEAMQQRDRLAVFGHAHGNMLDV